MNKEDIYNDILESFPEMRVCDLSNKVEERGWEYVDIVKDFSSICSCLKFLYKKDLSCLRETLEWHKDSLPGFTPEGFVYVLKYYLLYSLENPSSDVADCVVFHLSGIDKGKRYWKNRYNVLSGNQRLAIVRFLSYMKNMNDFKEFNNTIDQGIGEWIKNRTK